MRCPSRSVASIIPTMNDFLILLIHGFRAIFVHMNITQSTCNTSVS
ncbi:hypothetical protein BAZSYMB_GCONTIG00744_0 [Bathymodiolus azoricus thioautotrophic gill symbiont]|uniref:Uncharacterized protein n=1 Tax=Bathymodiolus azoricus thioautotrophic gill symbiont TaxID=235205 RepID=A0A1H6JWQ1_9GAMM|nr:hypothetical protein BAZSYMB_GCONTIG00744_0 [Bathymodiolus azoricus thioautotrophic gill symbiont]